jgi:4-amino-4-deoxy-L-arabinose transferase-like glycosyltransferase
MPYFSGVDSSASYRGSPKTIVFSAIGLCAFLAWQAFTLRAFIRTDTRPPLWGPSSVLAVAWDYRQALKGPNPPSILSLSPTLDKAIFPPAYYLAVMRAYDTPNPAAEALWANWFYMVILGVSLFGIAFHYRRDEAALLAPVFFACTPVVRMFYFTVAPHFAVMALVLLAYWMLLYSHLFERWLGSALFGAAFALGMLHMPYFFLCMLPALVVGLFALSDGGSRTLKALLAMAIALAGFAPWYLMHFPKLLLSFLVFVS